MFSFSHIAIVFIIALLVFGPEKLPEVARVVGKALADFRRASTDFRRVIEDEFAEIDRQAREKEEQARRKALEASTAVPAPPAEAAAASDSQGPSSSDRGIVPEPVSDSIPAPSVPGAVPGAIPNASACDSGAQVADDSSTGPAASTDGHPA